LVNNSNKKDRDEIESLRKQVISLKEESQQKEKYNKAQIERLNRQVNDLRTENNELRDEIAHYDAELRELREQQFVKQ
jgi:predicted  nucleic acid-binding Zn-ribbon protein